MSWPGNLDHLHRLLDSAPVGLVVVDSGLRIVQVNTVARDLLGCTEGDPFDRYVRDESDPRLDRLLDHPGETRTLQLDPAAGSKTLQITPSTPDADQRRVLFIGDISEKVALGRQLMTHRQPSRKLLYQLHSTATTMLGYTELIELMLEEEAVIAGDRLNVIRRYHKEVSRNLETLARLLKIERQGGRKPDSSAIPLNRKYIVIVDDEPAIATFIAELMKGLQYRVKAFSDPEAALDHCEEAVERIDLAIVDQSLPPGPKGTFIDRLLALPGQFPVVFCSDAEVETPLSERTYLCHKPIDISDLTRIVADLV